MKERRKYPRKNRRIKTILKKFLPDKKYLITELESKNLSLGGIFVCTEDLNLFDLGEEVEIIVLENGENYYDGKARVVRSAQIYSERDDSIESGFGLMFVEPSKEFLNMLSRTLEKEGNIII